MIKQQTQVVMSQMVQVTQLNPLGRVHGGEMIKMMDNAAACCASRYCGHVSLTVALDNVDFHDAI
ncbi:MAG: hotdog domain-containing protein, partial [Methanomassiliicoccales archaeon]